MVVTRFMFPYKLGDGNYLLINSLTGAVDIVGEDVMQGLTALPRGESCQLPDDDIENLTLRGYLYPSRENEQEVVDRIVALTERKRLAEQSICFVLCPTMTCNLRCPYCFEPHKMHEKGGLMTEAQVDQVFLAIDAIRKTRTDIQQTSINLFGGEPLLPNTRGVVALIMAKAAERDLPVSITSNGTYTHVFWEILAPYKDRILFDVTMDGTKALHDQRRILPNGQGTFDKVSENIDLILKNGFRICVRMNLNEFNVDSVSDFLLYVKRRGWHEMPNFQVSVSPVTNYTGLGGLGILPPFEVEARVQRGVDEALRKEVSLVFNGDFSRLNLPVSDVLGDTDERGKFIPSLYYCEASGALFYCMGPDGYVYPCNQIIGDPEWAIGRYDPELTIDPAKAALWHGRKVTDMPQCMECGIAFLCAGGCPVMAKRTTGSPMDSYCGTSKQELTAYLDSVAPRLIQLTGRTPH